MPVLTQSGQLTRKLFPDGLEFLLEDFSSIVYHLLSHVKDTRLAKEHWGGVWGRGDLIIWILHKCLDACLEGKAGVLVDAA